MSGELERGAASIRVELLRGRVTVRHGDDGVVLWTGLVRPGTWDGLWAVLDAGLAPACDCFQCAAAIRVGEGVTVAGERVCLDCAEKEAFWEVLEAGLE